MTKKKNKKELIDKVLVCFEDGVLSLELPTDIDGLGLKKWKKDNRVAYNKFRKSIGLKEISNHEVQGEMYDTSKGLKGGAKEGK